MEGSNKQPRPAPSFALVVCEVPDPRDPYAMDDPRSLVNCSKVVLQKLFFKSCSFVIAMICFLLALGVSCM